MVRKHEMSPSLQGMTSWTDGVHSALFAVTCCNHPAQTGETPAGRSAGRRGHFCVPLSCPPPGGIENLSLSLFRATPGNLCVTAKNIPDSQVHCPRKPRHAGIIRTSVSATVHLITATGTRVRGFN